MASASVCSKDGGSGHSWRMDREGSAPCHGIGMQMHNLSRYLVCARIHTGEKIYYALNMSILNQVGDQVATIVESGNITADLSEWKTRRFKECDSVWRGVRGSVRERLKKRVSRVFSALPPSPRKPKHTRAGNGSVARSLAAFS